MDKPATDAEFFILQIVYSTSNLIVHLKYAHTDPAHAEVDFSLAGFSLTTTFRMSQAFVPVITTMLVSRPDKFALAFD